jgi:hypothetical protein
MSDRNLVSAVRTLYEQEIQGAPKQHPWKTDLCLPLTKFAVAEQEQWSPADADHASNCDYCQRNIALIWREEHPSNAKLLLTLAQHLANPKEFANEKALVFHIDQDACRTCALLLKSSFVSTLGKMIGAGRRMQELQELASRALIAYVRLPTIALPALGGAFAPKIESEPPFVTRAELPDCTAVTLMETTRGELIGCVDAPDTGIPASPVLLELLGERAQFVNHMKLEETGKSGFSGEHSFGEFGARTRDLGPDCVILATPDVEGHDPREK